MAVQFKRKERLAAEEKSVADIPGFEDAIGGVGKSSKFYFFTVIFEGKPRKARINTITMELIFLD